MSCHKRIMCVCLVAQLSPTVCDPMDYIQAPLSTEFSRQEYWSGLSFPSPETLSNLGIKPGSSTLQADSISPPGTEIWRNM